MYSFDATFGFVLMPTCNNISRFILYINLLAGVRKPARGEQIEQDHL